MADMFLDYVCDEDEHGLDGFCNYKINDDGTCEGIYANTRSCRCCGYGGLHWGKYGGKWRLFERGGGIHECPANPLR